MKLLEASAIDAPGAGDAAGPVGILVVLTVLNAAVSSFLSLAMQNNNPKLKKVMSTLTLQTISYSEGSFR